MPYAPPKHCAYGHAPYTGRNCPECHKARRKAADAGRPGARQRGYSKEWEIASRAYLAEPGNQLCACGCGRRANVVDHIVAHKGDMFLFWDRNNWQPMAKACNTRKAIKSEGGFGRPIL